jgi:RNA polymerase sigma-70 factor (ECF subfamily)
VGDLDSMNVLVDEASPERVFGGRQVLHRLAQAFDHLPRRCREVVWLRRVGDLPQREVAQRMGISEKTVEKHLAKGMYLLAAHCYGEDGQASPAERAPGERRGRRHAD